LGTLPGRRAHRADANDRAKKGHPKVPVGIA